MKFLLDTTFVIDHLRGDAAANGRLRSIYESGDDPLVTGMVVTEAWTGARLTGDAKLDDFLQYLEYVHPGPETARLAGRWRAQAHADGRTLGISDAIIGATAFDVGAAVLTRNLRDFALMPVRVETY